MATMILCGVPYDTKTGRRIASFHDDAAWGYEGQPHDTYRNQASYVHSTGNKWAIENFEATRPYFA